MTIATTCVPAIVSSCPLSIRACTWESGAPEPPIVIVHGWGIGSSYSRPLAALLARHRDVYVPELPGHGDSPADERLLTVREQAIVLSRWMRARGLARALMVAHSFGCQFAAHLAAGTPSLLSGLVLIGPTLDAESRPLPSLALRTLLSAAFERPSLVPKALSDYTRAGPRLLVHELQQMRSDDLTKALSSVRAPALIIRGARDRIAPLSWARRLARLIRAPEPVSIAGCGHAVHYDDPGRVAPHIRALADFLSHRSGINSHG